MILRNITVVIQGATAFNHYPIMDASFKNSWARGFPIELIENKATQGVTSFRIDYPLSGAYGAQREVGVLQYLTDENPDIDAKLRLKRSLPMTFSADDQESSPVLVPTHSYSPYNTQASIHSRQAMFAMLLPSAMSGCISDFWRGYFAQCIFADIGLSLIFLPPKTIRKHNESNYHCDGQEEALLYYKSEELIEFLKNWDSDFDTVPQRMEQLWVDLNKNGYIEYEDVQKMHMWLKALNQLGYEFPPLKNRRFRNAAVMGQFNYVPSFNDTVFWFHKTSERFHNVIVAGPYSDGQVAELKQHSIEVIQGRNDRGFVSPYLNQMKALLRFKDDEKIDGVLYVHDDGVLNLTEIVKGKYPFPSEKIIMSSGFPFIDIHNDPTYSNWAYRMFKDGRFYYKEKMFPRLKAFFRSDTYKNEPWENYLFALPQQLNLAKDTAMDKYREDHGSIFFPGFCQADMMYVPTKYTDAFAEAAALHGKYNVFLEVALRKIIDMIFRGSNYTVHELPLCTTWNYDIRGTGLFIRNCIDDQRSYGFLHPYKVGMNGYVNWSTDYDMAQNF